MWIRTQDRETLIKCKYFDYECAVSEKPVLTLHSILGGVSPNELDTLAIYATKERCLEVLDEIEQSIKDNIQLPSLFSKLTETIAILHENGENAMKNKEFIGLLEKADKSCVYQMPKE